MSDKKLIHWFIISTFVGLYLVVSLISTIHVIEFFEISNPKWLAVSLAIAFEIGAAASLSSLIILDKMNRFLVWILFITLTAMQAMGNTYYAYTHLHDFQSWVDLFGLTDEELIYQKRILSIISGAILPLVSLGFIKSLVDYIKPKPSEENREISENKSEKSTLDLKNETISEASDIEDFDEIKEDKIEEDELKDSNSNKELDNKYSDNTIKVEDPVLRYRMGLSKT